MHSGLNFTKALHSDTYPAIDPTIESNHTGHAVFITGASSGIGLSTAHSYAKAGASHIGLASLDTFPSDVAETLRGAAKSRSHPEPNVFITQLDVLNEESIHTVVSSIAAGFEKLDILINCAGYMPPAAAISSSDDEEYWRTFEVNLRGTYRVTKAFLPLLLENSGGLKTVINISSIAAHNLRTEYSAYGISKYAILRFTEFLMAENADAGLVAYCVHPGAILTNLAMAMPLDVLASRSCNEKRITIGTNKYRFDRYTGDGGGYNCIFNSGKEGMACWEVFKLHLGYDGASGKGEGDC
jgi:NAD(P)-dependent dehydrogenase (short-subunit alcohol dehydrogenase family)